MSFIMAVPNTLEIVVQEFLLVNATNFSHLGNDVTSGNICSVLLEDTSAVLGTEWLDVFINGLFDILLIVSDIFLLLDEALPMLLVFFLFSLLFQLFHLLFLDLLIGLFLDFAHAVIFLLLGVFGTVDPLNMFLSLVILAHKVHDFIKFGLVLSFLFGITSLSLKIVICLNVSNFD